MAPSEVGLNKIEVAQAHEVITESSKKFGEQNPYSVQQGIREFAELFLREKIPVGMYTFKGKDVVYVNETLVSTELKPYFKLAKKTQTNVPTIYILNQGPAVKEVTVSMYEIEPEEKVNYSN